VRRTPRFFSRHLTRTQRRVYGAATAWFVFAGASLLWPFYVPMARVRPLVLGMPWSLFWLALMVSVSFGVAAALFRWESRRGLIDARPGSGDRR